MSSSLGTRIFDEIFSDLCDLVPLKSGYQPTGGSQGTVLWVSLPFHGEELPPHSGIPNRKALVSNSTGLLRSLFKMVIFGLEYFGTLAVSSLRLINWPSVPVTSTQRLENLRLVEQPNNQTSTHSKEYSLIFEPIRTNIGRFRAQRSQINRSIDSLLTAKHWLRPRWSIRP